MDLFGATVQPIVAFLFLGEVLVGAVLVCAFVLARLHKGRIHHYAMLAAFLTDLLIMKPMMYTRATEAWSPTPWELGRLAPHLLFSVVVAAVGLIVILLGFRHRVKKDGKMLMPPKGRIHRLMGYLFIGLWGVTFVNGVAIFYQTYFA